MRRRSRPARGVALITAILVVSIAVIAATAVLESGNFAILRTGTIQDSEQAWWYAMGAEEFGRLVLSQDQNRTYDGFDKPWMQPVDAMPVDRGQISGRIMDAQGLFNLNNLGIDAVQRPQLFKIYQDQFARLLRDVAEVDSSVAEEFSERIHDWIDPDQNPTGFGGAEDSEYLSLAPPYRAANRPMESISELLAIKVSRNDHDGEKTRKIYTALAKCNCVTALPVIGTTINVNTAPENVLRAIKPSSSADFDSFLQQRKKEPLKTASELNKLFVASDFPDASPQMLVDVKTAFVQIRVDATVGTGRVALYSLLFRGSGGSPVVLSRNTDSE